MDMNDLSSLGLEWQSLQRDHEQYERSALWLKVLGVLITFAALAMPVDLLLTAVLLLVVWLQEAIVRTGQSRLGARLLAIEALVREAASPVAAAAFQLHSAWHASRGGIVSLLREYAGSAIRPTVAFPHAVLFLILLAAIATSTT
jgi:hypothetical protein